MRSSTPYPCSLPSDTALRISRSNVPCNRSTCFAKSSAPRQSRRELAASFLDCQGESDGDRGEGVKRFQGKSGNVSGNGQFVLWLNRTLFNTGLYLAANKRERNGQCRATR